MQLLSKIYSFGSCWYGQSFSAAGLPLCAANEALKTVSLYSVSKTAAENIGALAYWGGKQLASGCDYLANKSWSLVGGTEESGLYAKIREATKLISLPLEKIDAAITDSMVPPPGMNEMGEQSPPTFQAKDLIGPGFLISFCGEKCLNNLGEAYKHITMLASGKRSHTLAYQPDKKSPPVTRTVFYTSGSLAWKTLLDLVGAAAGAAGVYYTGLGMKDVLVKAGTEENTAQLLSVAFATMCVAGPKLLKTLYEQAWSNQAAASSENASEPGKTWIWDESQQDYIEVDQDPQYHNAIVVEPE